MAPKLYKAAEVCEMTELQPYVLRSWEKEFPGIGLQKSGDGARLYRQSDVEQVRRIKQLVFGEGLTLAGARRRLEEETAPSSQVTDDEVADVLEALASDARTRIAHVRDGLRSILKVLSSAPGTVVVVDDFQLDPPAAPPNARAGSRGARTANAARGRAAAAKPKRSRVNA
jgi:DNA-binding transcriptional MerR regulator